MPPEEIPEEVVTPGQSVQATISSNPPEEVTPPVFNDVVSEEFRAKPFMKDVDSMDKLLTKFEGAQTLIGKKGDLTLPGDDATEEQKTEFYTKLGRPPSADKYELNKPEGFQETEISKEYDTGLKTILFKHGLTSAQASGLSKDFDELVAATQKKMGVQEEAVEKDFMEQAEILFKDRQDQVLDLGSQLIKKHAPPELVDYAGQLTEKLDNKALLLFCSVLDNINKAYISPDGLPPDGGGSGFSLQELEKELSEIPKSESWKNFQHSEHKATRARFDELGTRIAKMRAATARQAT